MKLLIIAMFLLSACIKRSPIATNDGAANSGLAEVNIAVPDKDNYSKYFGKDCESVKLDQQLLDAASGDMCAAIEKLLAEFRIVLSEDQCDSGVKATEFDTKARLISKSKLDEFSVRKGCRYNLLVELGAISEGKVYYSNIGSAKGALNVPKNSADEISLPLKLMPTAAAVALGFPNNETIETEPDAANVDIEVAIGPPDSLDPQDSDTGTGTVGTVDTDNSSTSTIGSVTQVDFSAADKILSAKCTPCHLPGKSRPNYIGNQIRVVQDAQLILDEIQSGLMPPEEDTQLRLTASEKNALVKYLKAQL